MRQPHLNRNHALIAVVVALLISSQLPARWADTLSSHPRHLVATALTPSLYVIRPISGHFHQAPVVTPPPTDTATLREDYELALSYARRLEGQLEQAQRTITQLSQARGQLNLTGVSLFPARVIAWSGDMMHPTLDVAQGRMHGIRPGMVVASGFNLVGRVADAGPVTAAVKLITAPQTQLVVRIMPPSPEQPTRELLTQLHADADGKVLWTTIDAADQVQVGDLAHLSDDTWPTESMGLVVGQVASIVDDPDDPTLRRRVRIQPIRPLPHLNQVVVIIPRLAGQPGSSPR